MIAMYLQVPVDQFPPQSSSKNRSLKVPLGHFGQAHFG